MLRATTSCTFSTSQLPKAVRSPGLFNILTRKCISRHNGVYFFDISTAKSGPQMSKKCTPLWREAYFKVKILKKILYILSGISSDILAGISSDILSGISSDILSDIFSVILSGISSDILSDIFSDILPVEVRQCPLRSGSRGPAGNTWGGYSRLRSGREHWAGMLAVEVRQGTLGGDGRGWGPAGNTGRGWSWLKSGREHWAWMVVVEVRQGILSMDGHGWGPAGNTEYGWSWLRSGTE